jgi:thiamine biosynthesis lipoprotein
LGRPPEAEAWKVAIQNPSTKTVAGADSAPPLTTVSLRDEALSVSAVWGKFFHADGKMFGHIIDPRTGQPAADAVLAAVVLPSATETDALSTALLTLGSAGHDQIARLRSGMRTLLVTPTAGGFAVETRGPVHQPS